MVDTMEMKIASLRLVKPAGETRGFDLAGETGCSSSLGMGTVTVGIPSCMTLGFRQRFVGRRCLETARMFKIGNQGRAGRVPAQTFLRQRAGSRQSLSPK